MTLRLRRPKMWTAVGIMHFLCVSLDFRFAPHDKTILCQIQPGERFDKYQT